MNPLPGALAAIGYWKAVSTLTARFSAFTARLGAFGGPVGTAVGFLLGAFTAGSIATTVIDALWARKGIKIGFTWRPTLDVQ